MAMSGDGAFVEAFRREMSAWNREFWEDNTAALIAYSHDRMLPSQQDRAEAKKRVGKLSDKQLSQASHAVAEADAKRCSECGREYDDA